VFAQHAQRPGFFSTPAWYKARYGGTCLLSQLTGGKMEEQKFSIILSYYTVSSRTSLGLHKNLSKKKGGGRKKGKEKE
jgi:predicted secreted Zn-dependent protease